MGLDFQWRDAPFGKYCNVNIVHLPMFPIGMDWTSASFVTADRGAPNDGAITEPDVVDQVDLVFRGLTCLL